MYKRQLIAHSRTTKYHIRNEKLFGKMGSTIDNISYFEDMLVENNLKHWQKKKDGKMRTELIWYAQIF